MNEKASSFSLAGTAAGKMTESMMWMTPLEHSMSVVVTLAPSTMTPSVPTLMVISAPLTVGTLAPSMVTTVLAITLPETTWYVRMPVSLALFSGLMSSSTVPAGSLAKASSVGAKTVNGPGDFMVSTRPAAPSAAARVLKVPAPTAVSTMSGIICKRHRHHDDTHVNIHVSSASLHAWPCIFSAAHQKIRGSADCRCAAHAHGHAKLESRRAGKGGDSDDDTRPGRIQHDSQNLQVHRVCVPTGERRRTMSRRWTW